MRCAAIVVAAVCGVLGGALGGCRGRRPAAAAPAPPPAVSAVTPAVGSVAGGTVVTLTGSGFQPGVTVTIGGVPVTIASTSAGTIVGVTGPAGPGAAAIVVTNPDGGTQTLPGGFRYDQPPTVTSGLAAGTTVVVGQVLRFTLTLTDPEGGTCSCTLENPPPGLVCAPYRNAASPAVVGVSWIVPPHAGGPQRLRWRVTDGDGSTTRFTLTLHVGGAVLPTGWVIADVTGDGIDDAIGLASLADTATLTDVGAIYVWAGGPTPSGAPTATLTVPGAAALDRLGDTNGGQALCTADVTGDGVLDIIAGAADANLGGVGNVGAIWVWAGGAGLTGAVSPTACCRVAGAAANDGLGNAATGPQGQGLLLDDVTGDGVTDLIGIAALADRGGTSDTGALYVWAGGAALSGTVSPTATCAVAGAAAVDKLGDLSGSGQGVWCADVTGDGIRDLVAGAPLADIGGVTDAGAVYVWAGGSGLTGTPAPTATATVTGAANGDRLGDTHGGQGLWCVDVTGDGTPDLVAGAAGADGGGLTDTGAVYVWAGGAALSGAVGPTATCTATNPTTGDQLGDAATGCGLQAADVTGDGTADLVVTAAYADVAGVTDTGAVYIFAGGSGLAGSVGPTAVCTVTGAAASDELGDTNNGQGVRCADVTGDGVCDVVAGAWEADTGSTVDTGGLWVWAGGTGLSGAVAPTARLVVSGAAANDQLTDCGGGQGFLCADVTGDGTLDVVAGACGVNGAATDSGAVYVWAGGALAGPTAATAVCAVAGAAAYDQLTNAAAGGAGQGVWAADVTGDGVADVIACTAFADVAGVTNAGAWYVWAGGSGLTGTPTPTAAGAVSGAATGDALGDVDGGLGTACVDLTGDGVLDLVVGAYLADVGGTTDAGACYVWVGGSGLAGTPTPVVCTPAAAAAGDRFTGAAGAGQGVQVADLTGDGVVDALCAAALADVAGVTNTGAGLWCTGGATPAVAQTLAVSGARAEDRLGR